ncbi:EAL domain-containing protein [Parashewanella spongiae]|uniref:EAL domain-containing protein n=1 Tax=Parashewanella spongiae TaxID=342950 RepID=UPI0014042A1E|nr:EAL domain-containing protein [Parashewanella spongiae]
MLALHYQKSKLDTVGSLAISQYQQSIKEIKTWEGTGKALYKELSTHNLIRFFQYIDPQNSDNNYTSGQILSKEKHLLSYFLPDNFGMTSSIKPGRLQVKLELGTERQKILNETKILLIALVVMYFTAAIVAYICFRDKKLLIKFLAEIINDIPNSKNLHHIRLPRNYQPIIESVNNCRNLIASKFDLIIQENEKLNRNVFVDDITKLKSRQKFSHYLTSIRDEVKPVFGCMIFLRASELSSINHERGRTSGDQYLIKIANILTEVTKKHPDSDHFRISSAEFAVVLPNLSFNDSKKLLESLKATLDEYQQTLKAQSAGHVGLIPYKSGSQPSSLVAMADTAISIAQTLGPNAYHATKELNSDEQIGDNRWKITIQNILKRRTLTFYQQPIQSCRNNTKSIFYQELLTRFSNREGKALPTAAVIAMAERHGLIIELDKMIIENVLKLVKHNPKLNSTYGINISAASALQPSFIAWMKDLFKQHPKLASKIILEIKETGMQTNVLAAANFVDQAHKIGARVSIESFGTGFTAFKFFKDIRPDFVKLDSSFTREIESDEENKFFVKMMVDIARRINVPVIATSIESQSEKQELEKLLVDGLQGFYISTPKKLMPS